VNKIRLYQYIAPEYSDGEKSYYIYKDLELPFIPSKDIGFQWSELGQHVWYPMSIHYNLDFKKYFVTIHARWFQIYDEKTNEYKHDESLEEMADFIEFLKGLGWTVFERMPDTYW